MRFRNGIIITICEKTGTGLIEDTNEQEIRFLYDDPLYSQFIGAKVVFEIILGHEGLVAHIREIQPLPDWRYFPKDPEQNFFI